eukprot:CAMPEP_0177482804 /NCGR_PEP_ID=MMETSP0369-20130122/27121_1 /TAXON_ID=447022 ORGANISM="Scrippsiella hangoei-like, Strain SHHI-4" /NCGR_SAMPLE_ID=MMETSP0369 /ASSEMBLY_ACC=CAM_ASM_000364 /LENGTH=36 /DNA_ID= /DNA_START= /DNA_END= /DNA_ORIENTATION=
MRAIASQGVQTKILLPRASQPLRGSTASSSSTASHD